MPSPESPPQVHTGLIVERCAEAPAYSLCVVFTRPDEYGAMRESFRANGFTEADTEFLAVDNSERNTMDAFAAYNAFLIEARAPHILLCHQDVLLLTDGRAVLDRLLRELTDRDPFWGLCGNAGVRHDGVLALRVSDPHRQDGRAGGPFPMRVSTLDENFLVVRRAANLALSRDISGFHMYGTDLCLIADILGWSAWVIDFHLRHLSGGKEDASYHQGKVDLRQKYQRALRPRWIKLPMLHPVFIGGHPALFGAARVLRKIGFWPRLNSGAAVERLKQKE